MTENYTCYKLGSEVFGMSLGSGGCTDHLAIFKARVVDVTIFIDKLGNNTAEYMLATPSGEHWGDSINVKYVSDKIEDLLSLAQKIWNGSTEFK